MMNEIDQLFTFGEIINPRNMEGFNTDATPLIKGKKATLDEAVKLIKKKVQKKEVHFSNVSCDLETIDKVIEISYMMTRFISMCILSNESSNVCLIPSRCFSTGSK